MKIKNLLFQPLTLHLAKDGEGLHLSARECKEIPKEQISEEIELAAARGLVSLIDKVSGSDNITSNEATGETSQNTSKDTKTQVSRKKGRTR